jgi:arsenical pump membrane protein
MSPALRLLATLAVFAATLLLTMLRPRHVHEAYWTCLGALALVALRLVSLHDVADVLASARPPLLFLLALLVLSALLECGAFFDWAAIVAARQAGGDARVLYRNVFLLGSAITAVLSLDTTAVILTPLVLAFVQRLRLPARPYVFACAFVANTASLPLPISNLTNLLFAGTFGFAAAPFAATMLLPQVVALAATYAICRRLFRAELPASFEVALLPASASVVPDRPYFRASVGALGLVCLGYFVAPLAGVGPYVPAFAVSAALAIYGLQRGQVRARALVSRINWAVFPFVVGLFVVVRGVENLGLETWAVAAMRGLPAWPGLGLAVVVASTAAASNLVNNLPAALLARGVLQSLHAPAPLVYGALLGANIGPNVVAFGSLATLLVLGCARERGASVSGLAFIRVGAIVTPLVLAAATVALALVFATGLR